MFYLKDPKSGENSVTLTLFIMGFVVALLKLLTSGIVIGSTHLGQFGGGDFAATVGALGAIYTLRRHSDNISKSKDQDK